MQQFPSLLHSWLPSNGARCVLCAAGLGAPGLAEPRKVPPVPLVSGGDVRHGTAVVWAPHSVGARIGRDLYLYKKAWIRPGFTLLTDLMGGALSTVKAFSELLPDSTD